MQVHDKFKIFIFLFLFNFLIFNANASNLSEAISAYNSEDYNLALKLLKQEIVSEPENFEAYKWLGKTYEAMFEIEKSLEAYKQYEDLKRNSNIKISTNPSQKPISTSTPTSKAIIPTPIPTPFPTVRPTLSPMYKGWQNIKITDYAFKNEVKLIPKNSSDMLEIIEKSDKNQKFFLVKCKIKYSKNIIIKQNSEQISLIDQDYNVFPLYAMSTYKFNYGGNKASQKIEVILVSDYYELSKKDSRNNVQFLFKVNNDSKIKNLSIKGYGDLKL